MITRAQLRIVIASLITVALLSGCEMGLRNMYNQAKYASYSASRFFSDGSSMRPMVPGTVAYASGTIAGTSSGRRGEVQPSPQPGVVYPLVTATGPLGAQAARITQGDLPATIPYPLSGDFLRLGKERFEIHCAPCHGLLGDGDGLIVQRGFPAPPSYHTAVLRDAPDWYLYAVMTNGYGVMYAYAEHVTPQQRWAIVAYIRALQLSQHARLQDVPAAQRQALLEAQP